MQMAEIKVKVDDGVHVEKVLRKFKRMCESFGVVKEYRKRQEFKKPSVQLKEKRESATKRRIKQSYKSMGREKI